MDTVFTLIKSPQFIFVHSSERRSIRWGGLTERGRLFYEKCLTDFWNLIETEINFI